mgnify:CR=1 FL=1
MLAYLRLLVNSDDEQAFKRVINFPPRGIGQTTINKVSIEANKHQCSDYDFIKQHINKSKLINKSSSNKLIDFTL